MVYHLDKENHKKLTQTELNLLIENIKINKSTLLAIVKRNRQVKLSKDNK
ncbi:MAG: hypothetical protein Tsb0014_34920 [Pleurocapsa sp.]